MNVECFIANIIAVGSLAGAESAGFGLFLFLGNFRALLRMGEPLCDLEIPSGHASFALLHFSLSKHIHVNSHGDRVYGQTACTQFSAKRLQMISHLL